ncbi:MAG: hypothetical protein LBC89_00445 [Bacteroidales bacterium]|jgi:hypothetical protein|nr:hypothetical protein [Bacteroidales bacterium]
MKLKHIIIIVLALLSVVIAFLIYRSIMAPVKFENLRKSKEEIIVKKMKDIREVELAFKSVHQHFTSDFDSLSAFLSDGKLPTVIKSGEIPDTMTERQALKLGLITRDTVYQNAFDVLSKKFLSHITNRNDFVRNLAFIPTTNRTESFILNAGFIERSGLKVPVVECRAEVDQYIKDENANTIQLLRNYKKLQEDINKFPGLKFGSMFEAATDGNWE